MNVAGKVFLVTGASSGIGARLARVLVTRGARAVLAARREDRLAQVVETTGAPERCLAVPTDVGDPAQLERLVDRAIEHFGALDGLVHNAGLGATEALDQQTVREIEQIVRVNLLSTLWLTRLALPHLRARPESVVVWVSSMSAQVPLPLQAAYVASKAGMAAAASGLRRELARSGTQVLVVYPGVVDTEMIDPVRELLQARRTPIHPPDRIARQILRGIEQGHREVIAGGWMEGLLVTLHRWFPALFDRILAAQLPAFRELSDAERAWRSKPTDDD